MLHAISIQLIWTDRPFAERVAAAAAAGFDLVDLWDRRTSDLPEVAAACRDHGIGINGFFGNRDHGLWDPRDRRAALDEIAANLEAAVAVGARNLHVFSNAIAPGGVVRPATSGPEAAEASCVDGLAAAAELARGSGVTIMLEHLNPVYLPGYHWDHCGAAVATARRVDRPEVRVVFDTFHQQLARGRLTESLLEALPWLGRIDLAGVPDRCEPGLGEIDFRYLRGVIARSGWDGTVTFELVPSADAASAVARIAELFPIGAEVRDAHWSDVTLPDQ